MLHVKPGDRKWLGKKSTIGRFFGIKKNLAAASLHSREPADQCQGLGEEQIYKMIVFTEKIVLVCMQIRVVKG